MFSEEEKKAITVAKSTLVALYNKKMSELQNPGLTSMFFDNCVISGGCISSILLGTRVNDIDIYCKKTAKIADIAQYLKKHSDLIKDFDDSKYSDAAATYMSGPRKVITDNAITLKNDVQFITFMSEEEGARKNFDFVHCTPYYDILENKLYISEAQIQSIKNMTLVPNVEIDRITIRRIEKYKERGWNVSPALEKHVRQNSIQTISANTALVEDDGEWEN